MITRRMFNQAYDFGIVKVVGNANNGVMARIGDHNFWFGGEEAENYNDPLTYINEVGEPYIKDMIYQTLKEFSEMGDEEEYAYYDSYIKQELIRHNKEDSRETTIAHEILKVINIMGLHHKKIAQKIAAHGHRTLQTDFAYICMYFLKEIAKDDYQCDERNVSVHNIAQLFINPDFKF